MRRGVCLSGRGVVVCWRALFVFVQVPDFLRLLCCICMEFRGPGCGFQAEVDAVDKYNSTPLHLAAWEGHAAVVTKLLQASAAVDAANVNGWTPLHCAAGNGHAAVAELLLQANASPTAVDKSCNTPADFAKQYGHDELAKRLLECQQGAASK